MEDTATEQPASPSDIEQYPSTPVLWPQESSCSSSASKWSSFSSKTGSASSPITPDDSCVDVIQHRFFLSPPEFRIDPEQYCQQPQTCQIPEETLIQAPSTPEKPVYKPSRSTFHDESYPPCLQCSLKSLPCDREWPGCSRCSRNGHAALCLMQRPRCLEDDICEGPITYTLRRTSETDAQWCVKELLEQTASLFASICCDRADTFKLLDQLQVKIDTQNWVIPDQCGPRDRFSIGELLAAKKWRNVEHVRGVDAGCRWKERVLQLRYGLMASDDIEVVN